MQRLDEAIQLFEVNTKLFPDIANSFDSLAEAYMISGNNDKAIENYKKILEIDPNNARIIENLKKLQEEK